MQSRGRFLLEAHKIINGKRENEYGKPENSFKKIADRWSDYLDKEIDEKDVALMMFELKMARLEHGFKEDSCIDALGYMALFFDMLERENERKIAREELKQDLESRLSE